jgi:hypothetical protein
MKTYGPNRLSFIGAKLTPEDERAMDAITDHLLTSRRYVKKTDAIKFALHEAAKIVQQTR